MNRQFSVDRPDVLWVGDVTEHPTTEGKVYLATVIDAFSRRVVGWSIADHLRAELVVDALQMAIWRRNGREAGTVMHTDHGSIHLLGFRETAACRRHSTATCVPITDVNTVTAVYTNTDGNFTDSSGTGS